MSYSSLPLPAEVTAIHGSLRGWVVEQNPSLANAAELRSLDLNRQEGEGKGKVGAGGELNVLCQWSHVLGPLWSHLQESR